MDNHLTYTFRVRLRIGLTIGAGLQSEPFQPIGTPATPAPPTLTDQETAGSIGAVSLTWPEVDANGPGPVRYTVLKQQLSDAPVHEHPDPRLRQHQPDVRRQAYSYSVVATNDNGKGVSSAPGPATQWRATGKPASWGAWSVLPTGSNNQARASFSVPPSRGAESLVRIYVDGTKVQQVAATGKTDQLFDVPNNLTSHSVMLEVCNEELACSQSAAQPVQTYGPLVTAHIHSITPTVDVTRISWTIEVDSNGDEATLTVTSDQGRNETFTVPVGVSTVTTQAVQLDFQQTENVTVTLSDGSPARGPVSATSSATTEPPPPPALTLIKGAACNDDPAMGLPKCDTGTCRAPTARTRPVPCSYIDVQNCTRGRRVFCSFDGSPYYYGRLQLQRPDTDQLLLRQGRTRSDGPSAPTATSPAEATPLIWCHPLERNRV